MPSVAAIFAGIAALLAVCACAYYFLVLWSARGFLRDRRPPAMPFTPPVSLLKPLRGIDPGMYESLRSHCVQEYPEYEIIFGVSRRDDPAIQLVEQLQREFPERVIRLAVCDNILGTNTKVSTLAQMLPLARHAYLLVNDSDIRVPRDYLLRVMSPMADASVGMVTCLYRGAPAHTLGARLESLGISTDFACGVLVARKLEGMSFGLGSTLAFPRKALEAIGGFGPILDYLADDFELGNRVFRAGMSVHLSDAVVEDFLPPYDLRGFLGHQLRWARTIRDSRRWGYVGLIFTHGIPWSLLAVLFSLGATWAWVLLAATAGVRGMSAWYVSSRVLNDCQSVRDLWLLPLRDVFALALWFASFFGHRIAWRGEHYILEKGKLRSA
ncbi:MAG: bacteriohopanetetrol glucosamine biosynthesis glycosyltransferase HpnI [Candidatus Korobacteraceae bacterium]